MLIDPSEMTLAFLNEPLGLQKDASAVSDVQGRKCLLVLELQPVMECFINLLLDNEP